MIDERELAELLRAATDDIAVPVAPARELAAAGNKRRHRRWVVASLATAAAVAAVAVAVPVVLNSERSGRTSSELDIDRAGCIVRRPGTEPSTARWARSGFSDPRPRMPYVVGDDGAIAAILFAQPLTTPTIA